MSIIMYLLHKGVNIMSTKSIFSERLNSLMKERGITQTILSDAVGITKQSISMYANAHRVPDIEIFKKMCDFFNVSADYFLGITDQITSDIDDKKIHEITGLSCEAIDILDYYNTHEGFHNSSAIIETINLLIENELPPKLINSLYEISEKMLLRDSLNSIEEIEELEAVIREKKRAFDQEQLHWSENHIPVLGSICDYININTVDEFIYITEDGILEKAELKAKSIDKYSIVRLNEMFEQTMSARIIERLKHIKKFKNGSRLDLCDSVNLIFE